MNPPIASDDYALNTALNIINRNTTSEYYEVNYPIVIFSVDFDEKKEFAEINTITSEYTSKKIIKSHILKNEFNNRQMHRHNYYELMYVLEGSVSHRIEDTVKIYPSNSCIIMDKKSKHNEIISGSFKAIQLLFTDEYWKSIVMHNDVNVNNLIHMPMNNMDKETEVLKTKEYIHYFPLDQNCPEIKDTVKLLAQIQKELENHLAGYYMIVHGLFIRFLLNLENEHIFHKENFDTTIQHQELILEQIITYIKDNNGRVNRKKLSYDMGYSSDYLNRILNKYMGVSLVCFGRNYCLDKAKELIITTDIPITDIIHMLEYSNRSYFYREFSARFGIGPGELRAINNLKNK